MPLKRLLLPIWNGGHRLAWTAGEFAGAVLHGRLERCACCGRFGPMLRRPRAIPGKLVEMWGLSPRVAEALIRKETLDCAFCGAKLRARRLAKVVMETFPVEGSRPRSLRDWSRRQEVSSIPVAEINLIEGLHEALTPLPGLAFSDFFAGAKPGEIVSGVRHEDLTRLTYADQSFDLVLTSETLEHVPDLDAALSEIRRVLVPGGWHLFTVPLVPGVPRTYPRMKIGSAGEPIPLAAPIFHPGGDQGYPVFTEIGADLPEILDRAGFDTEVRFGPMTEDDIGQVFASRRRG
ncbi:MAG: ubiG 2 [Planctomycetota bacterium]|nr:ubiG 2 [Planctomycetota bacterium]